MRSDLRQDLEELAPPPSRELDLQAVWRRGRQLRHRRALYFSAAVLVVVGGVAGAFVVPFGGDRGGYVKPGSPAETRSQDEQHDTNDKRRDTADSYPLLYRRGGLKVYAPGKGQPYGRCPQGALPLRDEDIATARRVISIAARVYVEQGQWDRAFKKAKVISARVGPAGIFRPQRKTCGLETARRTVVLGVTFPKVAEWSASMGSSTFYVSREKRGWVIWDQPN